MTAGVVTTGQPRFRFRAAGACNMCGAPSAGFRYMGRRLDRHQGLFPRRRRGVTVSVVRCGACGLVFSDPMPLPTSVSDLYDLDPQGYWNDEYFRVDPAYLSAQCAVALALLDGAADSSRPPRALDVGAGIGKGILALRRAGFRAVGIEPSPSFRKAAVERMGIATEDIVPASLEEADYPAGSFEFVNLGAVLEHVADPRGALERIAPWLASGGIVHAEVPSARWLLARSLNTFYRLTGQGFVTNTSPMHPPFHLYEFTEAAFRAASRALGYQVARADRYVGDVYANRLVRGLLRRAMAGTGTGMQLAVWLRKP